MLYFFFPCFLFAAEKFYVSPDSIIINDRGIFFTVNQDLIPIRSIAHDGKGLYVTGFKVINAWVCPKGHWNSGYFNCCQICGVPNPEKVPPIDDEEVVVEEDLEF